MLTTKWTHNKYSFWLPTEIVMDLFILLESTEIYDELIIKLLHSFDEMEIQRLNEHTNNRVQYYLHLYLNYLKKKNRKLCPFCFMKLYTNNSNNIFDFKDYLSISFKNYTVLNNIFYLQVIKNTHVMHLEESLLLEHCAHCNPNKFHEMFITIFINLNSYTFINYFKKDLISSRTCAISTLKLNENMQFISSSFDSISRKNYDKETFQNIKLIIKHHKYFNWTSDQNKIIYGSNFFIQNYQNLIGIFLFFVFYLCLCVISF